MLCQIVKPRLVFEIGTMKGDTCWHFALNTSPETKIYTLDLPPDYAADPQLKVTRTDRRHIGRRRRKVREYVFAGTPVAEKISLLFGDSASFDFTPFHRKVDFFFIDGAHSYEYVRSDTINSLRCIGPGGIIAWHDFGRRGVNGVSRCLRELARWISLWAIPGGSLAFTRVGDAAEADRALAGLIGGT